MPDSLLDTNILLYAISTDEAESDKKRVARELLARDDWGVCVQVLQEFYVNATRPGQPAMSHEDATTAIRHFLLRPVAESDAALLLDALEIRVRYRISFWDAAVVAAGRRLGARLLYSEDLNDGQTYGGIRVVNPFKGG